MSQTPSQGEILRALLQGEEGRQWASERSRGWVVRSDSEVCSWDGVQCSPGSQVVDLTLPETDLLATIPSELALLTALETINLSRNLLRGTIPPELASMTSLVSIILKDNPQLTGSLPVFKSSKLKHLDLSRMALKGRIPPDFGQPNLALTLLELTENELSGFLPYGLEDLPYLETISVSSNKLSGTMPAYIGHMSSLSYLYLNGNFMVGTIPNLSQPLKEVWLQSNLLSGTIPSAIDLSVLQDFYLDGNKLTGTVPQSVCKADLNADFFTEANGTRNLCDSLICPAGTVSDQGVFPCRNCTSSIPIPYLGQRGECNDWTEARIVNELLGENRKSACDYAGVVTCNNEGQVTKIQASGRGLTGTLPDELGLLQYLDVLDVSDNDLNGFFPSGLRFASLTSLHISGNKLIGILPPLVCNKANQINNGTGDCTSIACPIGSYSNGTGFGECLPCMDGAPYLASTSCSPPDHSINPSPQLKSNFSLLWGLLFAILFIGFGVCMFMYVKYKGGRKKTAHWERGVSVDGKSVSFPHADEVKTMLEKFRDRTHKSSSNNPNWIQNRLRRSYHYAISLKETEAVNYPPGTKPMDVTAGEIDDFGWKERDSIIQHRDLENILDASKHGPKLEVWEYPDPLEKPITYTKSFDDQSDDDDDLSEWIKKQQSDPSTREVWLDIPSIE